MKLITSTEAYDQPPSANQTVILSDKEDIQTADSVTEVLSDTVTIHKLSNVLTATESLDTISYKLSHIVMESISTKLGMELSHTTLAIESMTDDQRYKVSTEWFTETLTKIYEGIKRVLAYIVQKAKALWRNHKQNIAKLEATQRDLVKKVDLLDSFMDVPFDLNETEQPEYGKDVKSKLHIMAASQIKLLTRRFSYNGDFGEHTMLDIIDKSNALLVTTNYFSEEWSKVIVEMKGQLDRSDRLFDIVQDFNLKLTNGVGRLGLRPMKDNGVQARFELGPLFNNNYLELQGNLVKFNDSDIKSLNNQNKTLTSFTISIEERDTERAYSLDPITASEMENLLASLEGLIKSLKDRRDLERTTNEVSNALSEMLSISLDTYKYASKYDYDKKGNQSSVDAAIDYEAISHLFKDINHNLTTLIFHSTDLAYKVVSSIHQYVDIGLRLYTKKPKHGTKI